MTKMNKIGKYHPTKGVGSMVNGEDVPENERHVLQVDLDGVTEEEAVKLVRSVLPNGAYIVLRSSEDSFIATSLDLFSFDEVIHAKAELAVDDPRHLKIGIKRGYWILRTAPKGDKPAPEFAAFVDTHNGSEIRDGYDERYMSKPHAHIYAALHEENDLWSLYPTGNYVGKRPTRELYPTEDG